MSNFTNRVGLPGLITFGLSLALAWALEIVHVQPKIIWLSNGLFLALPFAWMCLLPICGAVGATISRRRGGSYLDRMAAAASPAIIFAVALLFISIAGFVISIFVPGYEWNWKVVAWGLGVWGLGYAVLPSLALMIGVIAASLVEDQRAAA